MITEASPGMNSCVEISGISIGLSPQVFAGILVGSITGVIMITNVMSILITKMIVQKRMSRDHTSRSKEDAIHDATDFPPSPDDLIIENDSVFDNMTYCDDTEKFPLPPSSITKDQDDVIEDQPLEIIGCLATDNDVILRQSKSFKSHRKSMDSFPDWDLINSTLPRDILSSKPSSDDTNHNAPPQDDAIELGSPPLKPKPKLMRLKSSA